MRNELSPEQFELLASRQLNAVLATVDISGNPNTAPVHLIWPQSIDKILVALATRHQTSENLKLQARYSLSVMAAQDMAFSVQGAARLLRQPMDANPHMALFELSVDAVKPDTTPTVAVVKGVETERRSDKTSAFFDACFDEMQKL